MTQSTYVSKTKLSDVIKRIRGSVDEYSAMDEYSKLLLNKKTLILITV